MNQDRQVALLLLTVVENCLYDEVAFEQKTDYKAQE